MTIEYNYVSCSLATSETWEECSKLYSNHYGCWSKNSPTSPGESINLSVNLIREFFINEHTNLYQARIDGKLIGYAIAITVKIPNYGRVSWVTQLVVHENFRNQDVAKNLLFSIWGLSNYRAWGILSANPYAIRALEKATRRRCQPKTILNRKKKLLDIGKEYFPFLKQLGSIDISDNSPKINTEFFVDHSHVEEMINLANSKEVPWLMGNLEEGWEWFAFTFDDQQQISLTSHEIEKMITASDQLTKIAYSRMQLNNEHQWMKHTDLETEFILKNCKLKKGYSILDLGCGMGRHSISLAKNGYAVTGVDYIPGFINKAKDSSQKLSLNRLEFIEGDCRKIRLPGAYDAAICLYDVIGSFADDQDNKDILKCIANHLKPSGMALISVMNYELAKFKAKNTFSFKGEANRLLDLPASQIMEKTGNVFDPNYYLLDEETRVVYRKEQFLFGENLPVELIVRDRRFEKTEIEEMCESVGLVVEWSKYVGAGKWDESVGPHQNNAKEILVLCRKKDIS